MNLRRAVAALLLAAAAAFGAACGEADAPVATTTVPDGTTVPAKRYLADVAAAAAATRDVAAVLRSGATVATPARLTALASALEEPAGRTRVLAQRLTAARLADSRLEGQRAQVAPSYRAVSVAVDDLLRASEDGDAAAAVAASTRLAASLDSLRAVAAARTG